MRITQIKRDEIPPDKHHGGRQLSPATSRVIEMVEKGEDAIAIYCDDIYEAKSVCNSLNRLKTRLNYNIKYHKRASVVYVENLKGE